MIEISPSPSFNRAYNKKVKVRKEIEEKYWKCIEIFINDPFDRRLKTHKLSGKLSGLWSFTVGLDIRVIFFFSENNQKAIFIDIGKHDEVY